MCKSTTETWIKFRSKFLAVFEFPSESLCGLFSVKLENIRAHLDHKPCKPIFVQFMMVNFILIWHLFVVMLILFELTYDHKNNIHHNSLCVVHPDSKVDYWSCVLWRNKWIMCKITHTGIYLSIIDSTELCHMTRLVFRHALIVIVVTHIPHTLVIYAVT
jgi:hypothetical protein